MVAPPPVGPGRLHARRALLVTSYDTGATEGMNVGVPGYSYDFVARLFRPLLERCGHVIPVRRPREELEGAIRSARSRGLEPLHVSFFPFQDAYLSPNAPNVIVPAWEFPDVPDHAFDGNPQNDWVATSGRCAVVAVGGEFTAAAFAEAGMRAPIQIVPVPTPGRYFEVEPCASPRRSVLECPGYVFGPTGPGAEPPYPEPPPAASWRRSAKRAARLAHRRLLRPLLPGRLERRLRAAARGAWAGWRDPATALAEAAGGLDAKYRKVARIPLEGVVYTSIFNPADGRKNWEDLLGGFLCALKDRDDATLLVKLINGNPFWIRTVLDFCNHMGFAHRCTVAFVTDFLPDEMMLEIARRSTYYITTTRAEGNCLPLMNYLAAGRPAVSPCHTAISDYFGPEMGFVVESHPELAAWPQDRRLRRLTTWRRLVWSSFVEQVRDSHRVATEDRELYRAKAERGRLAMRGRVADRAVLPRLRAALGLAAAGSMARPAAA